MGNKAMTHDKKFNEMVNELQAQIKKDARNICSETVLDHFNHPRNIGVVPKTDAFAMIKGPCGDTMGISLEVENDKIRDAKFKTDGCAITIACGSAITEMVINKTIDEVFKISAADLIMKLGGLPKGHKHCALLTVNTLYSAVGRYIIIKSGGGVL